MEADGKDTAPIPQKRPAEDDESNVTSGGSGESAPKKMKPASSFSELASMAAAKETPAASSDTAFSAVPSLGKSRASLISLSAAKTTKASDDSDHADSPASILPGARFSNSPVDGQRSAGFGGFGAAGGNGNFALAPPTLAAPGKKTEGAAATAAEGSGDAGVAAPVVASAEAVAAPVDKSVFKSHLIKDFGFGPRPELDKAPKPSIASENPFLQCLKKKSAPASSAAASAEPADDEKASEPSRFVFGQNLTDRAKFSPSTASSTSATNGSSTTAEPSAEAASAAAPAPAAAAASSSSTVHDLPLVDIVTGEEGEKNVVQISCRFYNFNKETRQWLERGRGVLRLNDKETPSGGLSSRLVIRATGSLRVMVNCWLWPGQNCEKVTMKSARMSVMNGNDLEIVLVKALPVEIADLVAQINKRVNALKNEKKIVEAAPPAFTTSAPSKPSTDAGNSSGPESAPKTPSTDGASPTAQSSTDGSSKGDDAAESPGEDGSASSSKPATD